MMELEAMMEEIYHIEGHIESIQSRMAAIEARFEEQTPISFPQVLSVYEQPSIPMAPPPPDSPLPFPSSPSSVTPRGSGTFQDIIKEASLQYGVDPALLQAVIHQESGGNPNARSPVGAMGLMQLMPDTARFLGVSDAYDPRQNVFAGTRYLKGLLDQFGGNISLALAAYNSGPNAVKRCGWRIPPYLETQNYVRNILGFYRQFRNGIETSGVK